MSGTQDLEADIGLLGDSLGGYVRTNKGSSWVSMRKEHCIYPGSSGDYWVGLCQSSLGPVLFVALAQCRQVFVDRMLATLFCRKLLWIISVKSRAQQMSSSL